MVSLMSDATTVSGGLGRRRWVILGVIGLAQLMVVLDLTVMNIALPSAQRALHFTTVDRQWVVTAYALAFGSLLLLGGRLADLLGRKVTFLVGLVGFAGVSAIGGASVNFTMLVTARACQGAFAALLVPSALSLLTTTFTEPKDRSKAFAVYGAIAGAGGGIGLLLGGALTEYLSWRWCMYVNLLFAGVAFAGGALLLTRQASPVKPRLDIPGVVLVSGAVFCLVYGFSNAATHNWHTPSTWGFLVAGVVLLIAFALWQGRAARPGDRPVDGERLAAVLRRGERGGQQGQRRGHQQRGERALAGPRGHQHGEVDRGAADGRDPGEADQPGQERDLPARQVRQPAPQQQQAPERQRVRGDHPLPVHRGEVQRPLRRRQRDVHHRKIEDHHQLSQADHAQDQPPPPA